MLSGAYPSQSGRVGILLSTFNGEAYLSEQLDSIVRQTWPDWKLYWRDDGSSDGTVALMRNFAAGAGAGRCLESAADGRMRVPHSYLTLLREAVADGVSFAAFADQDDVWLADKLRRGVQLLGDIPASLPALYCARQIFVDGNLRPIGLSALVRRPPGFPAALTQNIATGCTMMLNREAALLVAASKVPPGTLHDWWCYVLVTAAGGRLIFDSEPVILYRQHAGNAVGAPCSLTRRGLAAIRRGPGMFMDVFRQHVTALAEQTHLLSAPACIQLAKIDQALRGTRWERVRALATPGFRRQTWPEDLVFRLWFLAG
ncbi:MAG: glycosyltransferase family 2 protein [Acetobacteraceae bacterium]|nr:glycosyltransferase family 2 protein [Acetobacteraceae bacterium]